MIELALTRQFGPVFGDDADCRLLQRERPMAAAPIMGLSTIRSLREHGATEQQIEQFLAEERKRNEGLPIGAASVGLIPSELVSRIHCSPMFWLYKTETQSAVSDFARGADPIDRP